MKKRLKTIKNSTRKPRRLALTIGVAIAIIAIAAVTVISKQSARMKADSNNQKGSSPVTTSANRNYVTVKVAGRDVQVDSQTGQIKELTPEEAQKMAAAIKRLANQSAEGLEQVREADGSVTMDLQDRFQNVAVARRNADGSTSEGCFDNPQAAAAFFGIDPQLVEDPKSGNTGTKQPRVTTPRN